jgi:uncharacterized damage-inducible protein DinB
VISIDHVRLLARYNAWQNASLRNAADGLSEEARRQDRGAFWGSIHGTLNHILWADQIWMSRFSDWPKPTFAQKQSALLCAEWTDYKSQRESADQCILAWAQALTAHDCAGDLVWYSGALGREATAPKWVCLTHFFNHQTHHRGQVHAMLTDAGARPEDTDLFLLAVQSL